MRTLSTEYGVYGNAGTRKMTFNDDTQENGDRGELSCCMGHLERESLILQKLLLRKLTLHSLGNLTSNNYGQ